jgi:hypothetical protein
VRGWEADLTWQPTEGFHLTAAVNWVDSEIQSDPPLPIDPYGNLTTFVGEQFPYTPEWQDLSLSPWYIVFIGPYGTEEEARKALKAAESVGYKKYLVKFSGETTIDNDSGYVRSGVER